MGYPSPVVARSTPVLSWPGDTPGTGVPPALDWGWNTPGTRKPPAWDMGPVDPLWNAHLVLHPPGKFNRHSVQSQWTFGTPLPCKARRELMPSMRILDLNDTTSQRIPSSGETEDSNFSKDAMKALVRYQ